jgi:hypothetical protein
MLKKRLLGKKFRTTPSANSKRKPQQPSQPVQARRRALSVLRRMRRTGVSLASAAREEHIDPRTVRRHIGDELRQTAPGRPYRPTKADRVRREMLAPTKFGMEPITIRGSRQASQLGKYLSAVRKFLHTGNAGPVSKFDGKKIGGLSLITDPQTLRMLAHAGALQLEDIYAAPGGAA